MIRRKLLYTLEVGWLIPTAGCINDGLRSSRAPLHHIRVVNLSDDEIQADVHIENSDDEHTYSRTVEPIDDGPSEEWILEPDTVDNVLAHDYTLQIDQTRSTIAGRDLENMYGDEVTDESCFEVSWLVADPSTDIGGFPQHFEECSLESESELD